MKKLALTMLAKEDIANCRKNGKKRGLKKIAEALEKLVADEPEAKETAATAEVTSDNEADTIKESEKVEITPMYCLVGRKYRIVYSSLPDTVTILAVQEKAEIETKKK